VDTARAANVEILKNSAPIVFIYLSIYIHNVAHKCVTVVWYWIGLKDVYQSKNKTLKISYFDLFDEKW